jgi:hypothetical protein
VKSLGALGIAVLLVLGLAAPARAERVNRTVKQITNGTAAECRRLGLDNDLCTAIGGIDVSEARMRDYEGSWVHRALGLQRALDENVPFLRELVPHTHNSFNSSAYGVTLTQLDPNQLYSMRDQLRMDMRGIEMDVHKWPHVSAKGLGLHDVVLCHGEPEQLGPITFHVGCSNDRPFTDGLKEFKAWLVGPGKGQVVILYLENNLDGDPVAHARAAKDVQQVLGKLVYRPPAGHPCASMPMEMSRADIRAAGAQVLIVGNCGPGAWGTWVHERGRRWNESSSPVGDTYPDFAACPAERTREDYAHNWIRRYEDSTWLSAMVEGTGLGGPSDVTATETRRMVRCGVNMPGFDQLTPQDPRLANLVWSWAVNEPLVAAGDCAVQGADARFYAHSCADSSLLLACRATDGAWSVAATCPSGTRFSVPPNGYENELLRAAAAAAGVGSVRLAYRSFGGTWTVL